MRYCFVMLVFNVFGQVLFCIAKKHYFCALKLFNELVNGVKMKKILYLCLFLLCPFQLNAQISQPDFFQDSIEFSLLTCSPSAEIYALYGHTAIRYRNVTRGEDWTFNYGLFDFTASDFVWRFTKGECDYCLGLIPYDAMIGEYKARGSAVYGQVLNLSRSEKEKLFYILMLNYLPENRNYRYNFLYDNCTTRARDKIEESVSGTVVYPVRHDNALSYREIIHQYTAEAPWAEVGQDLCLGVEADYRIDRRQEMFAPFYFRDYLSGAVIRGNDGCEREMVLREDTLVNLPVPGVCTSGESWINSFFAPKYVLSVLILLTLLLQVLQYFRNRIYWGVDVLLQMIAGLMGCVVTFLFFFSEHPTVGTNWQILLLNPLHLLLLPRVAYCAIKKKKTYIHHIYIYWLMFFMVFSTVTHQDFSMVVISLACILLIRSIGYLIYYKRNMIE